MEAHRHRGGDRSPRPGGLLWLGKGSPRTGTPSPPESERGGWVDVTASVNVGKHTLSGIWKSANAELTNVPSRGKQSLIELPIAHTGCHDLQVRFTKTDGADGYVYLGFRKGEHAGGVVFNDRSVANGGRFFTGVAYLDGKAAEPGSHWVVERPVEFISLGVVHEALIRVRDEGLAVQLDGEEVYRWKGDWSRLTQQKALFPDWLGRHVFALGCYNAKMVVHSVEVRSVSGDEARLLPPAPERAMDVSDAELRAFAGWLFSLPLSTEANHAEHKIPDLLLAGWTRNLRRVSELPAGPFIISRVRMGPLRLDDAARENLGILGRMSQLWDLRIYAAEDAEALSCVRNLTQLGTLVFKAAAPRRAMRDETLAHLARLGRLSTLRLHGWAELTGSGFMHLSEKRKLSTLMLDDCPEISDEGLAQIACFTRLESLSLNGAAKITDAGLRHLQQLHNLKALSLTGTAVSAARVDQLNLVLPACTITR